jgi:hypothetical protein
MTRTGKIARLPRDCREELNRRLRQGENGRALLGWLNGLPEVQVVLNADFGGRGISDQNLSEWRQGGYLEWLGHQETLALAHELKARAAELETVVDGSLAERVCRVLTARYATELMRGEDPGDDGRERRLTRLRALCADVVELRRGDLLAEKLKLDRERLSLDREKTDEAMEAEFNRWLERPDIKERLFPEQQRGVSEETIQKVRRELNLL